MICLIFVSWGQILQHQFHSARTFPRACTFRACVLVPCWLCLDACHFCIPTLFFLTSVWGVGDRACRCSLHTHTHTLIYIHTLWWYQKLVGSVGGNFPVCCCRKTFRWKKKILYFFFSTLYKSCPLGLEVSAAPPPLPRSLFAPSFPLLASSPHSQSCCCSRSQAGHRAFPHRAPWSLSVTDQTDASFAFITCSLCCF